MLCIIYDPKPAETFKSIADGFLEKYLEETINHQKRDKAKLLILNNSNYLLIDMARAFVAEGKIKHTEIEFVLGGVVHTVRSDGSFVKMDKSFQEPHAAILQRICKAREKKSVKSQKKTP